MAINEKHKENQAAQKARGKKASTTELPMVDLKSVLEFADKIETEGLQTLSQQEVAKRLRYAAQTSTPFYRRIVAAKLFGLIDTNQGVNLTKLALDYFKPTDEESKMQALVTAVKNVVGYQGILERFSGKRLPPVDILKNAIEREFQLAPETATACAEVFVRSSAFAAIVKDDGTLSMSAPERSHRQPTSDKPLPGTVPGTPSHVSLPLSDDSESHYLTLDAKLGRRVIVHAPPVITTTELKRIQTWLAVQLHVIEPMESDQSGWLITDDKNNDETGRGS